LFPTVKDCEKLLHLIRK